MQCCKLILHTPVPACRAGFDPRQAIARRFGLSPGTAESPHLQKILMNFATSVRPATELTTIGATDRGGGGVWPNDAKQAHNYATHLPAAMAMYEMHKPVEGRR